MREMRWMNTPEVAHGCFFNGVKRQRKNGTYPKRLFPHNGPDYTVYHANLGKSILAVDAIHPDNDFSQKACDSLSKYARHCDTTLDPEGCGLYDVYRNIRIARESLKRHETASDNEESNEHDDHIRLKGVDATVDMYCMKKALSLLTHTLGRTEEAKEWEDRANKIKRAVLNIMWDPSDEMFYDVDPNTMERTRVKAVTCFYPYMTDIIDESHIQGLKRHLLNPEEFWTPYPVATLSRDDPAFHPEAEWKGKRYHHPWNGRVWPIANCLIVEALACAGNSVDESLKGKAVELMTKFIHMMFMKDNVRFPHSYEHYNPISGKPSLYRSVDDVQHTWLADLILEYVAGVQPQENSTLVIDPFPFKTKWVRVENLPFRGHMLTLEIEGESISLLKDGVLEVSGKRGTKIEVKVD
jgi:glycogen debranching enzyme